MKIRFSVSFIILFIYAQLCLAQDTPKFLVGLQGSPTVYLISKHFQNKDYNYQSKTGYSIGFTWQFNFSKRFALRTEINYEQTGYTTKQKETGVIWGDLFPFPYSSAIKTNVLTMPITMKFNMMAKEKTNLFLNTGFFGRYLLQSTYDYTYLTGERYIYKQHYRLSDNLDPYVGGVIGLGVERKINKHLQFSLEARDYLMVCRPINSAPDHSLRLLFGVYYNL